MRILTPALSLIFLLLPTHPAEGQRREVGFPAPSLNPPAESLRVYLPQASRTPGVEITALGAVLGAAAGTLAGGLLGGAITSRDCDPGNPDACLGEAIPGLLVGAGLGYAMGAPVGAHLANGRRGKLGSSLLVSSALFGVQAITVGLIGHHASTSLERSAVPVVFIAIPAAQLISAVTIERRTTEERSHAPVSTSSAW